MQAVHALLFQLAAVLNVLLRLAGQAIQLLLKVATVLQPLYPAVGYILCANIVAVAGSCEPDTAAFVALTGQGLAVALITYETLADVRQSRSARCVAVVIQAPIVCFSDMYMAHVPASNSGPCAVACNVLGERGWLAALQPGIDADRAWLNVAGPVCHCATAKLASNARQKDSPPPGKALPR